MPEAPNEYTYFSLPTAEKPIPTLFFLSLSQWNCPADQLVSANDKKWHIL